MSLLQATSKTWFITYIIRLLIWLCNNFLEKIFTGKKCHQKLAASQSLLLPYFSATPTKYKRWYSIGWEFGRNGTDRKHTGTGMCSFEQSAYTCIIGDLDTIAVRVEEEGELVDKLLGHELVAQLRHLSHITQQAHHVPD